MARTGRPQDVYCCWRPQQTQLLHEVLLTEELIRFPFIEVNRGKFVDPVIRPDATLLLPNGLPPLHVELDRATESTRILKRRVSIYLACKEPVLWIAPTDTRLDAIRRHASALRDRAYFKTLGSDVLYGHDGTEYAAESLGVFPGPRVTD